MAVGTLSVLILVAACAPAPGISLDFDTVQATATNGTIIGADPTRVCGAPDRSFLAELTTSSPLNYKIPFRLADVVAGNTAPTATLGQQMMVSGTVAADQFGTGDFPFDHPFGSDFNMDVKLDAPYANISQSSGLPSGGTMHVELNEGMFPHTTAVSPGPVTGMTWESNAAAARANLQAGYVPSIGDRVIVMGRWVNDCGHLPFGTELHPISFLAWSHVEANKTVVHTFFAPYREKQLYNPDPTLASQVNDVTRDANLTSVDFPKTLIQLLFRIQGNAGPILDHLEVWGMVEANKKSPADWWVCAPAGTTGKSLDVRYDFVARPGVSITATPDKASGCAQMHTAIDANVTPDPTPRICVLSWAFLDTAATAEIGGPPIDLKAKLAAFVAAPYRSHLDPDPIQNCYDPVVGPSVSSVPAGQNVTTDATVEAPFYGRVEVAWAS